VHLNPQRQSNLEAETSDCAWTILSGLTRAVCLLYFRHYFGLVLTTSPCIQTLLLIPHVSEAFVKRSSVHLNSDRADAGYAAETPSASTRNTSINMIISIHNASLLRRSSKLVIGSLTCPSSPFSPSDRHHLRLPCPRLLRPHLACPIPRPLCLPSSSSFVQHRRRLIETVGTIFGEEEVAIDPAEEQKITAVSKSARGMR